MTSKKSKKLHHKRRRAQKSIHSQKQTKQKQTKSLFSYFLELFQLFFPLFFPLFVIALPIILFMLMRYSWKEGLKWLHGKIFNLVRRFNFKRANVEDICSICFCEIYVGDHVYSRCHIFHDQCFQFWVDSGMPNALKCPYCLSDLPLISF